MVSIGVFACIHLGLPRELIFQLSPCPRGCFLLCPSGENSKIFAFWVFDKTRKWGLEGLWLRTKNLPRPSQRCFPTQPTPNTYKRRLRSFPNRSGWFSTLVILALRLHFMVFSPKMEFAYWYKHWKMQAIHKLSVCNEVRDQLESIPCWMSAKNIISWFYLTMETLEKTWGLYKMHYQKKWISSLQKRGKNRLDENPEANRLAHQYIY